MSYAPLGSGSGSAPPSRSGFSPAAILSSFLSFLYRAFKYVLRIVTGTCEIERRMSASVRHSPSLTSTFADCLRRSRQLGHVARIVLGGSNEPFDVAGIADEVLRVKNISAFNSRTAPNVRLCMRDLNGVCRAIAIIRSIRDIRYDQRNADHEARLERLWNGARPGMRREGGRITLEWQEIGFQGDDPATDFRGMGVLGLANLEYLSTMRKPVASKVLARQATHGLFFAITGINVTAYVLQLLESRRLDPFFYSSSIEQGATRLKQVGADVNVDTAAWEELCRGLLMGARDDEAYAGAALYTFSEIYTRIFLRLAHFWENSGAENIMAFTSVFNALQAKIEGELRAGTFRN